ncbi:MAG TPA: hypothetical protein VLD40_07680 [Dissulfurispiraceae bacterium]|nr:hypothetical protein [Dissulfurispiraceae bacterium]
MSLRVASLVAGIALLIACAVTGGLSVTTAPDSAPLLREPSRGVLNESGVGTKSLGAVNGTGYHGDLPVYRIPLRVHLGSSGMKISEYGEVLGEINDIWLSQAGICFEMHVVASDEVSPTGMDIWFTPTIAAYDHLNGYYSGDHDMRVRDFPALSPAPNPARHPAARTAAHEFGHALGLPHRQDSNDNLMRSKTYGWHLSLTEVHMARQAAGLKALPDLTPRRCNVAMLMPQ